MATQRRGTVSYPGSTPGWASNVSNEEDSDPAPFLSLTEMHQGVSMRQAESTYFCLATRDGSLSQPWSLVDRSKGGARLAVDDPANVPDQFTLVQKGAVTTLWKCRVVWRSDSHVGVKFEGQRVIPK